MKNVIIGVGNILRGDDGLGVLIAKKLKNYVKAEIIEGGTSLYKILLSFIEDKNFPEKIIIIDTFLGNGDPIILNPEDLQEKYFSSHLFPSSNIFQIFKKNGVLIKIIAIPIKNVPDFVTESISIESMFYIDHIEKIVEIVERLISEG